LVIFLYYEFAARSWFSAIFDPQYVRSSFPSTILQETYIGRPKLVRNKLLEHGMNLGEDG
jgi:hypothetical protein